MLAEFADPQYTLDEQRSLQEARELIERALEGGSFEEELREPEPVAAFHKVAVKAQAILDDRFVVRALNSAIGLRLYVGLRGRF